MKTLVVEVPKESLNALSFKLFSALIPKTASVRIQGWTRVREFWPHSSKQPGMMAFEVHYFGEIANLN
jgi:hypothetical protein